MSSEYHEKVPRWVELAQSLNGKAKAPISGPIEKLIYSRLLEFGGRNPKTGILPFSEIFPRVCPALNLPVDRVWNALNSLRSEGLIEIVPYEGVRVLFALSDDPNR